MTPDETLVLARKIVADCAHGSKVKYETLKGLRDGIKGGVAVQIARRTIQFMLAHNYVSTDFKSPAVPSHIMDLRQSFARTRPDKAEAILAGGYDDTLEQLHEMAKKIGE